MAISLLTLIFHIILILATVTAVPAKSSAFVKSASFSTSHQFSPQVLSCTSSDPIIRGVCDIALEAVNTELEQANIAIRKDGVLFTYDDPKEFGVPTGHSCSVTAKVRHQHATAHFSSSSTLKLTGNSISEKIAVRLRLPVRVNARVDVRQRFGFRFFGKCRRLGRDSYTLKAGVDAHTDVVVGVSLNPSFRRLPNGNLELTLMPAIAALFELDDLDLKFRVSGVSPITPVVTFIVGFKSSLLKSVTSLFKGDSLKSIFKDLKRSLVFDIAAPVVLGIGALPRPFESVIFDALLNIAERKVEREAKGFGESLEDILNNEIQSALKVGSNGKRVFVIKGNFLDLQKSSATLKELFADSADAYRLSGLVPRHGRLPRPPTLGDLSYT